MDDLTKKAMFMTAMSEDEAAKAKSQSIVGLLCAVCGHPITGEGAGQMPYKFRLDKVVDAQGRLLTLICHGGYCHDAVVACRRWQDLPPGPLRTLFSRAVLEQKIKNSREGKS